LYVPAPQISHAIPLDGAVYPRRHIHAVSRELLADEKVLSGQGEQDVDELGVVEYVPASHGVHVDAPTVFENVPATQAAHSYVAPTVPEYFPGKQEMHVDAPTVSEYVPVTQNVHVDVPVVLE
jgi:hypothetical protein